MLNKRIRTYSFYDFRTQYTSEDAHKLPIN